MIKIPNPYFSKVPKVGDLELYDIFYALERPILFLCKEKNNQLYLCSCCKLYPRLEWVISSIEPKTVIKLIDNKISIAQALFKGKEKFFAVWEQGYLHEHISSVKAYDDTMVGDMDDYLDVEDGDFNDLKQRLKNWNIKTFDRIIENIITIGNFSPKTMDCKSFLLFNKELNGKTIYTFHDSLSYEWDDTEEDSVVYYQSIC